MRKDNKKLITKARAELKRGEISRQTYLLLIEHLVEAEKIITAATRQLRYLMSRCGLSYERMNY